jgi:hypothetical protein
MFWGCTGISLYEKGTSEYRIPSSGTGTVGTDSLINMFTKTGGTFKGTPEINKTYYLVPSQSLQVTFKVVNGAWNDGKTLAPKAINDFKQNS